MLKASAVVECLLDVCGNHRSNAAIVSLVKHVEGGGSGNGTKEVVDCCNVGIMGSLVKKLHELTKRLVDEKQVTQRNGNRSVGGNGVQAILDALSGCAVL